ncbi:hypothetical protein [Streptomyces sp. CS090A]|uniref:hypothetical protein n=1 Tax=Streptomyces sp. CS090A TaxID=2162710 RepID=UPI001951FE11|nr:hypothetical protein [Streptomyces sp. CS090A]
MPNSQLSTLLPGEHASAVPAFVAYAVAVRDLAATRKRLHDNGFSVGRTDSGDIFVPAASALGAAIIFREASQVRR